MSSSFQLVAAVTITLFLVLHQTSRGDTPNVVILYADDMGYGDLGIQNPDSKIPTPALDQLAREGTRFTDAHSSSGICTPSRYALLTGRYHWRKFHDIVGSFGDSVIDANQLTLAEMLKQRGYDTACIGKWHLGWNWQAIMRDGAQPRPLPGQKKRKAYWPEDFDWEQRIPDGPLDHGFDYYYGDDVPNFPPYTWIENDRVVDPPIAHLRENPPTAEGIWEARPGPMAEDWQLDQVMPTLTDKAVGWIESRQNSDAPFFLYFPFTSPHAPIVPTGEYQGSSKAGGYGDFMTQTDGTVGAILKALDEFGFRDNTIVIFTSDNGPEAYAWARVKNFQHESMGPLRGLKRDIWEGGHRVPMIVRWPNHVPADRASDQLVSQIDLMATLADITACELPVDAADDSLSQVALLTGKGPTKRISLVHNTYQDHYAIRSDNWLLVAAQTGAVRQPPKWFAKQRGYHEFAQSPLLFDLENDVGQVRNVAHERPELAAALQALLTRSRSLGERNGVNLSAECDSMTDMLSTECGSDVVVDDASLERLLQQLTQAWIVDAGVRRLLILPPDHSRLHSRAGEITAWLWRRLGDSIHIDVMPTLGTHEAMSRAECELLFGPDIPFDRVIPHRWRHDLERLGEISSNEMSAISHGKFAEPMNVEVNARLFNGDYDLVLSVGQVVPHEVIGLANYTKNVCIGAGGKDVIHKSHFLGAVCGMESIMGQVNTPVRQIVDHAYEQFVRPRCEVGFVLTVVEESTNGMALRGVFAGKDRDCYERAAELSRRVNISMFDEPIERCVVALDPQEYKSTWLGNKAIYRTRMAMADGGELIVLAPGVRRFGEDPDIDALVRRHGYRGTPTTLNAVASDPELRENLSAAAHLIHGSSEGRFRITYCPGPQMDASEIEQVGFDYRPHDEAARLFEPESRSEGWHVDATGERFYFIRNPGLGLWSAGESRFEGNPKRK